MAAVSFDTLAFVKKLEASGVDSKQAEALSEAFAEVFEKNLNDAIFTKHDGEILRLDLDSKISKLETRIILWMAGFVLPGMGLISGIVFTMVKLSH